MRDKNELSINITHVSYEDLADGDVLGLGERDFLIISFPQGEQIQLIGLGENSSVFLVATNKDLRHRPVDQWNECEVETNNDALLSVHTIAEELKSLANPG
jgi:hypothetical protein